MKQLFFISLLIFVFRFNTPAEDKYIALTFDDGPHTKYTLEILDILKENNAVATFFVIGENACKHPSLIKTIEDMGCEIGNHTWSHKYLDKLSENKIREELSKADSCLFDLTGKHPRLFRPPGGRTNNTVMKVAEEFGYVSVLWSKDTRDWACPSVSDVISSALKNPSSGDIILFHDYNAGKSPTPTALRQILPQLLKNGYKTVTVSKLLEIMGK